MEECVLMTRPADLFCLAPGSLGPCWRYYYSPQTEPFPAVEITDLLWSLREKEQARASLRQSVHELHQALGIVDAGLLRADRNHLALSNDRFEVDALTFASATPSRPELLDLYCRPLLEDLQSLDPAFDRWLADQSDRLAQVALAIGESVLREQREQHDILKAAEQLLRIDGAHEVAWRAVIGFHLACGDHGAGLAAYERCRSALALERQLAPSHETEALVENIRYGNLVSRDIRRKERRGDASHSANSRERGVRVGVIPLRRAEPGPEDAVAFALVEEIIIALTKFRWITCVANVTMPDTVGESRRDCSYRLPPDLDFVLDGTIQRCGNRVRIIARLSELRTGGTVVWARRYDRCVTDVFALQDEIASETAAHIDTALLLWEGERARSRRIHRSGCA